jgi:SpoVK/Ycf46/Vps4 family AAA+-type ATPase
MPLTDQDYSLDGFNSDQDETPFEMTRAPRSPHWELVRRWLLRLRKNMPRPFQFHGMDAKAAEAEVIRDYFKFTYMPRARPLTWKKLDDYLAIALHVEDPAGGLLELPETPALNALKRLAGLCGFSDVELHLLVFAFLLGCEEGLRFFEAGMRNYRRSDLVSLIAGVIGSDAATVAAALRPTSPLLSTGLLVVKLDGDWDDFLEIPFSLRYALFLPPVDPMDLLQGSLTPAPAATLTLEAFPHLATNLGVVRAYLREATAQGHQGVNVLLHGRPGTGKTQLARAIAADLGFHLHEVTLLDECGNPRRGLARLQAFCIGQRLLGRNRDCLLLFDEMEAAFALTGDDKDSALMGLKAWLNQTLENNAVPCVWITNTPDALDPAFLRRFDIALKVDVPPRSVRRGIIGDYLADLPIEGRTLESLADHEGLAPAVVARAAKVVACAVQAQSQLDSDSAMKAVINEHLRMVGAEPLKVVTQMGGVLYSPDHLNPDADLAEMLDGLRNRRRGRLLFYGPPGTGKSAFAAYLAEQLDRPLRVKRASDLLSKWVGGTEGHIRQMFREAAKEDAVLLLDEADGFLTDRREAQQHWQVSQANELLTRLEDFTGIFVGTTNLLDTIDGAALRRFDLKVRFDFMKPHQILTMFKEVSRTLSLEPSGEALSIVQGMASLTPGDFANIVRQSRLSPLMSEGDLVARLQTECRLKPEGRRRAVGF